MIRRHDNFAVVDCDAPYCDGSYNVHAPGDDSIAADLVRLAASNHGWTHERTLTTVRDFCWPCSQEATCYLPSMEWQAIEQIIKGVRK